MGTYVDGCKLSGRKSKIVNVTAGVSTLWWRLFRLMKLSRSEALARLIASRRTCAGERAKREVDPAMIMSTN